MTPVPAFATLDGANQIKERIMPPFPVSLVEADHDLTEPAVAWKVEFLDTDVPTIELLASLRAPGKPIFPPMRGETATTLAIQMDPQVAMSLYLQLHAIGHSMGWLPPPEAAHQA